MNIARVFLLAFVFAILRTTLNCPLLFAFGCKSCWQCPQSTHETTASSCVYDSTAIKAYFSGCYQDVQLLISTVCRRVWRDQDRRGGPEQLQDGHRALRRAIQLHQRETETPDSCHVLSEG